SLHWQIVFHHNTHTHPFIDDLVGSPQSFVWATSGESDPDVGYEIILSATDSSGLVASQSILVKPRLSNFTLQTNPAGLQLTLDGQPITTPLTVTGVVGYLRTFGATSPQTSGSQVVAFSSWSDGGVQVHTVATPPVATTYTATYANACSKLQVIPPNGGAFAGSTSGDSTLSGTCAKSDDAPERVYSWTPPVSGTATLQTCGSGTSFDTVMYHRAAPCATGSQLACN